MIGRFIDLRRQASAVGPEHLVGELWQANSPSAVRRGEPVRVLAVKGLTLEVAPIPSSPESSVNQSPAQSPAPSTE